MSSKGFKRSSKGATGSKGSVYGATSSKGRAMMSKGEAIGSKAKATGSRVQKVCRKHKKQRNPKKQKLRMEWGGWVELLIEVLFFGVSLVFGVLRRLPAFRARGSICRAICSGRLELQASDSTVNRTLRASACQARGVVLKFLGELFFVGIFSK